jgi:hypothetical protein
VPYHGHWHQKDPDVGDEVGDVGEVGEGHHGQAFACDRDVPIGIEGATGKEQCDGDANAPGDDKQGRGKHDGAEEGMDEDAVVEGEDSELDRDEGEVVEVAEDVVALAHHHLVIVGDDNDMVTHAMGRAWWWCQLLVPVGGGGAISIRRQGANTISETAGALRDQTECRK